MGVPAWHQGPAWERTPHPRRAPGGSAAVLPRERGALGRGCPLDP